jgi:hypothetical protein
MAAIDFHQVAIIALICSRLFDIKTVIDTYQSRSVFFAAWWRLPFTKGNHCC